MLSKFSKKEISFVLGSPWTVQIVCENPELSLSGPRILPDYRVDVHHSDIQSDKTFRVGKIEFEHVEFERKPDELDPRGTYNRSFNNGKVQGVVSLQNGKYRLTVQLNCQLDNGAWMDMTLAFTEMTRFAFDIVCGDLEPDEYRPIV